MFAAAVMPPLPYHDPWTASFEERVAALSAGQRRIAYFYERPDTSTFRYRVFNMIEALAAVPGGEVSASWFTLDDLDRMERFIDRADALVICRTHYTAAINRMVARAKARGLRVLFDVDDFVFDPDYVHLVVDTLDQNLEAPETWDAWFGRVGRLGATLRLCDGVIVTNQFLAERVADYAPRIQARVIPNFLNRNQAALSRHLFEAKRSSGFARDGNVYLGYFSGTPTHNRDFEIAAGALARLLDEDTRLVLRVVGFLELKGAFLRHRDRVEVHPLQDFLNLQRLIAEVEVNLVPMQDNVFTNCKSELKYFEAAIAGTISVASPTFTFRNAIRDGENGYLACAHEWQGKVRAALDTVDDADRYEAMVEQAFRHAEETYGWDQQAAAIAAAVFGHAAAPTAPSVVDRSGDRTVSLQLTKAVHARLDAVPTVPSGSVDRSGRTFATAESDRGRRDAALLGGLDRTKKLIEIGPSFAPIAPKGDGWTTTVVDHSARADLITKYGNVSGLDVGRIEEVDVVWNDGPLHKAFPQEAYGSFDALIASHVLEHLPDLAGFLVSAEKLLNPSSGVLALALPDKRFCFDYFRPISTTGQVLAAHAAGAKRHSRCTAFDELAYSAPLNGRLGWGREPVQGLWFAHSLERALEVFQAVQEGESSAYVDFHAWQFTPASFELMILELGEAGVIDWRVEWLELQPAVEFLVRLRRGRERFSSREEREKQRLTLLKRIVLEAKEQIDWLLAGGGEHYVVGSGGPKKFTLLRRTVLCLLHRLRTRL